MNKANIYIVLTTVLFAAPCVSHAAYPVYPNYQQPQMGQQIGYQQPSRQQMPGQVVAQSGQMIIQQQGTVTQQPTRVTGNLPQVGSTATNAGRQYYQANDYDRLVDSGLYVGLSVGYAASISGSIEADYKNEQNAFLFPGAFKSTNFQTDTVIPLQLSVGASINNDVRVDFSYTRYRGIEYPGTVETSSGDGKFVRASVTGGAITANATMLNVYYNIDSYTGNLIGGSLRPYIGAGVGLSLNTIADYVIYDKTFYSEVEPSQAGNGDLTGISDIYAYHNGGTVEQLAYMLEGGVTTEMDGGIKIDFFVRYTGLGKIKTSGSIVMSQTEWYGNGQGQEFPSDYDSVSHQTNWYESGNLGTVDVGVRLRLQF